MMIKRFVAALFVTMAGCFIYNADAAEAQAKDDPGEAMNHGCPVRRPRRPGNGSGASAATVSATGGARSQGSHRSGAGASATAWGPDTSAPDHGEHLQRTMREGGDSAARRRRPPFSATPTSLTSPPRDVARPATSLTVPPRDVARSATSPTVRPATSPARQRRSTAPPRRRPPGDVAHVPRRRPRLPSVSARAALLADS